MKIRDYSIATFAILITALFFISCENDDDSEWSNSGSTLELDELKGAWTTVAVNVVSPSHTEDNLFDYSFRIYWDDGYLYESKNDIGEITLENSTIKKYETSLMKILSYNGKELKIRVVDLNNAVLTMKKLGTLNDEDYRIKLCHGSWINADYDDVGYLMSYEPLDNGETAEQKAILYGNNFQVICFVNDGTGECYCGRSGYSFNWFLEDKKLLIKYSNGTEKSTNLSFKDIEGTTYLKYDKMFSWKL